MLSFIISTTIDGLISVAKPRLYEKVSKMWRDYKFKRRQKKMHRFYLKVREYPKI